MPEFRLDPCIEDELWGIWRFIAQDNPDAADRVLEAAYETFKKLATHPHLRQKRRFRDPKLRDLRSWRLPGRTQDN